MIVVYLKCSGKSRGQLNGHCFTQRRVFRGELLIFPLWFDELKAAEFYSGIRNLKHFIMFCRTLWELTLQSPKPLNTHTHTPLWVRGGIFKLWCKQKGLNGLSGWRFLFCRWTWFIRLPAPWTWKLIFKSSTAPNKCTWIKSCVPTFLWKIWIKGVQLPEIQCTLTRWSWVWSGLHSSSLD